MDVKQLLRSWCNKNKYGTPKYKYDSEGPKNHMNFKYEVRVDSFSYVGIGISTKKKRAQVNAAQDFIQYLVRLGRMNADVLPSITQQSKKIGGRAVSSHDGSGRRQDTGKDDRLRNVKGDVCQTQSDKGPIKESSSSPALKRKRRAPTNDGPSSSSPKNKALRLQKEGSSSVESNNKHVSRRKQTRNKKPTNSGATDPYSHLTERERQIVIRYNAAPLKEPVKDSKSSSHQSLPQQKKCPKSSKVLSRSSKSNNQTSRERKKNSKVESQQSSVFQTISASSHGKHSSPISNILSVSEDSVIFVKQTSAEKTPSKYFSSTLTSTPNSQSIENQTVIKTSSQNPFSNLFTSTPVTSSDSKKVCPLPTLTPIGLPSSISSSNQNCDALQFTSRDLQRNFSFSPGGKGREGEVSATSFFSSNQNKTIFNTYVSESPSLIFSSSPNVRALSLCARQEVSGQEKDSLFKTLMSSKDGEKKSSNDSVIIIDSSPSVCAQPKCKPFEVIEILDSDTEDMDVDDDDVIQSLLSVREQTINLDAKDAGSLSETINNTAVHKVCSPKKFKQLVLVMDTNVLIHSLSFFANLLNVQLSGFGRPLVLLPWMVILELDKLKIDRPGRNNMGPAVAYRARKATRLLQKLIMDHHPQLVSQKPTEVNEQVEIPIHSNDDRILHCCLQWQKKHKSDEVILVTRDRNLSTKALITGLKTSSNTDLWTTLGMPIPTIFLEDRPNSCVCTLEKASYDDNKKGQPQDHVATERSHGHVFAKLSSVWNLILNSRSELLGIIEIGVDYPKFNDACSFLNRLQDRIICLANSLNDCLSLSPVILRAKEAVSLFLRLQLVLNSFYDMTGTGIADSVADISSEQLIGYFEDVDNRLRLSKGLEELGDILSSINALRTSHLPSAFSSCD